MNNDSEIRNRRLAVLAAMFSYLGSMRGIRQVYMTINDDTRRPAWSMFVLVQKATSGSEHQVSVHDSILQARAAAAQGHSRGWEPIELIDMDTGTHMNAWVAVTVDVSFAA
jgi:hypothetical protein